MTIDEQNNSLVYAEPGKVLKRISDGIIFGNKINLGYTFYLNNKKLSEPLLELPEHYIEVDASEYIKLYETINKVVK